MKQLIRALRMLMKHNAFHFGSTFCLHQDSGAIGQPPAADWAKQFARFYEMTVLVMLFIECSKLGARLADSKGGL